MLQRPRQKLGSARLPPQLLSKMQEYQVVQHCFYSTLQPIASRNSIVLLHSRDQDTSSQQAMGKLEVTVWLNVLRSGNVHSHPLTTPGARRLHDRVKQQREWLDV